MRALRRFATNRAAVVGAVGLAALVAACVVIPIVSPYDPYDVQFSEKLQGPSWSHPLGTDFFGRDVLTRLALAGRTSMLVALGALVLIFLVGATWGTAAGLAGGKVDGLLMRVVDGLYAIPRLPLAIVLLVVIGLNGNEWTLIGALALVGWLTTARLVRGQIVSLQHVAYVEAARALGARRRHVAIRHLLPNSAGVLVVALFLELPAVILGEAFLSVLGLGLAPPAATWGNMAQLGQERDDLSLVVLASAAIAIFAVCANLVADGLQDALDPRREAVVRPRRLRRLRAVAAPR
jgi:ABC-type dipeptide/oligopeptide/nickel transport system permease subunit